MGEERVPRLSGGEALVAGLIDHGIDTVFGLPGAQIYGFFDALKHAESRIRTVGARHEQACGYMAFGYARSTGRPSAYAVVPGPGVLNTGSALLTAYGGNEPVLCLTGQVPTPFLGRGRGHLHEMPDQLATLRSFTKWAERVLHPGAARLAVARAFQEMRSGRPGPAALEMPWDVFTAKGECGEVASLPVLPAPEVDEDAASRAAELIAAARAPMIFVGSGAIGAADGVLDLAELLDAPVVAFRSGRGIVSNDHELGLTMAAAHRLWPETDLMIGIGTRMELPSWRWSWRPPGLKAVRIDIDPAELLRSTQDVAMLADSAAGTRALAAACRRKTQSRPGRREAIREARAVAEGEIRAIQPQMAYLDVLRELLPRGGIVTDELSQVGFASWFGFPVYLPRTFISSGYQGTLGSGFPTALGAKVAHPDRPVVAICGDGGFMFAVQELATAVQYGVGVVTLVFNNGAYGNVRRDQRESFGGRVIASDLVNPDFVALARSFGVTAERVESPEAFRPVLARALDENRPWLIEVTVPPDGETSPWRFIHPPPPAEA
jgi:acetolactate synthase-1/2/3 large subunit